MGSGEAYGKRAVYSVNVRALAEFMLLSGDLTSDGDAMERMHDGAEGHRLLQKALDKDWNAEEWVSREEEVEGIVLRVQGRADAVLHDEVPTILEIKTTYRYPNGIGRDDYPAHWAQAQIYAYIIAEHEQASEAIVSLLYYRMDGASRKFTRRYTLKELRELFLCYAVPYARWLADQEAWHMLVAESAQSLKFPFEGYRRGQKDMIKAVYSAARHGKKALIEAPTGIGKTAAALYGAVRAIGAGHPGPVFYLTARTTGKQAAEAALEKMRKKGLRFRSVTLTAKEKSCPDGTLACDGCPLASGYYDRRKDALREAASQEVLDQSCVEDLAREYRLCPFELSLDIAMTCDAIICDYNYVFDPQVRLKRFFDTKSEAILLIDEAHNLPTRAREMYSCEISPSALEEICRQMEPEEGKDGPFQKAARELLKALETNREQPEHETAPDSRITEAVEKFAAKAAEMDKTRDAALFVFEAQRFVKMSGEYDGSCYRVLYYPEDGKARVRLWCWNPTPYIQKTLSRVGGTAMFSATLAPMYFYAQQLSLDKDAGDRTLTLASPFPWENLLVLRLSLPTTLRERERTLEAVVRAFHALGDGKTGNYLACFPSHAYLGMAYKRFRMLYPEARTIYQKRSMTETERKQFLECFQKNPKQNMFAFIAMGGVFSEGVDLPDDRLSGAAIVSAGVPQIDMENELLRELADDAEEGYNDAYVYPGMRRILQAAGRVIRTETDRGVILLIDDRFRTEKYEELMPSHWHVRDVKAMSELKKMVASFWNG